MKLLVLVCSMLFHKSESVKRCCPATKFYYYRICKQEAALLGNKDKQRLLSSRKLALVVDLDQTLIHTSVDPHVEPGLPVS